MSAIHTTQSPNDSTEVHSPILDRVKLTGTPAYDMALNRLLALGISYEEAVELLKD